jgi:LysR family glycine cleavage system transcriptional activator
MSVNPPRPRGPHLNAMRCFETAARVGGFAAAAEELSVTAGAVSQQIKSLEDWIGAPLFERRSQGVVLTPLGDSVREQFSQAFDALGTALHTLRINAPEATVNIAALPAIAQLWLSPRLQRVRQQFPNQSISINALEQAPNLKREICDISLFFGQPTGAKTEQVLGADVIFPVCAPALAAQITNIDDLQSLPRIYDATWVDDWRLWLKAAGAQESAVQSEARFSLYSLALQEARNGAGVMIGHASLVERDFASGALVAPFDVTAHTGKSLILQTLAWPNAETRMSKIIEALLS